MIARCGPIPNRNKCMIDDCERIQKVRGMCSPHYMKWYHRGGKEEPKLKASNGEGTITPQGYIKYQIDGEQKLEHVLVAEKALGKPLPKGAVVHHINENPSDNRPSNLVVCPDQTYHAELHQRMKRLGISFK